MSKKKNINKNKFTFVDLFCGVGGFHMALEKEGGKCVMACDIDKYCREVYLNNHKLEPLKNIRKINNEDIPDHDILCGGFPCQTFSNAGKKKALEDKEKGTLFNEIIRIIKHKKPKICLLENVKHILRVAKGSVYKYINEEVTKCGYKIFDVLLSPHHIGIPQNRERVIFIIIRNDLCKEDSKDSILKTVEKFKQIAIKKNKGIIIRQKKEEIADKYFVPPKILKFLDAWNELIKKIPNTRLGFPIIPSFIGLEENPEYKKWRNDYIRKNNSLYMREGMKDIIDEWWGKHSEMFENDRKVYGKLEWQVGPVKEEDSIFNYYIQIRQSGIRVKRATYFPTLVAISQIPIYAKEKRYLTPRECARLQSIPDSFKLHELDRQTYKQMGNGVNVDVINLVARSVLNHIKL